MVVPSPACFVVAAMVARCWRRGQPLSQPVLAQKLQRQANALVRLLDLQQMPGALDEAVVVAALGAERLVGRAGRWRAFEIRIAANQLHRPAEFGGLRPKIER